MIAYFTLHLSEALLPALAGLFVAIPAYWFHQHCSRQVEIFSIEMDHASTSLINRLIVYLANNPFQTPRPNSIELGSPLPPPELNILLRRIWPNGFSELVWPRLHSTADATLALHLTGSLSFIDAGLVALTYIASGRPISALIAVLFFVIAGRWLRSGSYLAAASLLTVSVVSSVSAFATDTWSFRAITLTLIPPILLGWYKALRSHALSTKLRPIPTIALSTVASASLIATLFDSALCLRFIYDPSMEPALHANEALFGIATPLLPKPRRGDLVYLKSNEAEGPVRIVGLPGDRIQVAAGHLIRNGQTIDEPYVKVKYTISYGDFPIPDNQLPEELRWRYIMFPGETVTAHPAITVPPGRYFVLNDNRNEMMDSRMLGPQFERTIIYRPFLAIPLKNGIWSWPRRVH